MWLHIIGNDPKFVTPVKELCELAAPGKNVFSVFSGVPDDGTLYECSYLRCVEDLRDIIQSRNDWNGVIFHPLAVSLSGFMKAIPKHIPVINSVWGGEFYGANYFLYYRHQFLPKTLKAVRELDARPRWRRFLRIARDTWRLYEQCRRVVICYGTFDEEFELFRSIGLFSKKTQGIFGIPVLRDETEIVPIHSDAKNILLGNSSTPTNNHIEAIDRLAKLDLTGRKVIVPLAYGDLVYREFILKYGREKLGDNFVPLFEFMPHEEYCQLLSSCGVVIMNHLRQQGVGNILIALMSGAKVFLNNTPVYQGLTRWGVAVEEMESVSIKSIDEMLSESQKENNRCFVESKFSVYNTVNSMKNMFDVCLDLSVSK